MNNTQKQSTIMRAAKVITTQLFIQAIGAQNFFSVSLPHDAKRITGVDTTISGVASGTVFPRKAGTLRLRMGGYPGDVYAKEVEMRASAKETYLPGFPATAANAAWLSWNRLPFVAGARKRPERIRVANNESLSGWYSDELMKQSGVSTPYTVTVAIHVEVEAQNQKTEQR